MYDTTYILIISEADTYFMRGANGLIGPQCTRAQHNGIYRPVREVVGRQVIRTPALQRGCFVNASPIPELAPAGSKHLRAFWSKGRKIPISRRSRCYQNLSRKSKKITQVQPTAPVRWLGSIQWSTQESKLTEIDRSRQRVQHSKSCPILLA